MKLKLQLLILFMACFPLYNSGQNTSVKLSDIKSGETIPYAHICIQDIQNGAKKFYITNAKGELNFKAENSFFIQISCIGYKLYQDTLENGKNHPIKLYPEIFGLDQAVVTASFTRKKADKSIYNVKVIDKKDIQIKAASNLADAMSDIVNIKLSHDPALGTSLRLKGLSGNNIKILIDGVPVIGRVGGNIDLSQLNLYNIDHIEMVEGPLSVIYGSNALAGAINIITKEHQYSKLNVATNAYYETVGTYNLDAGFSLKKNNHHFSLSGGRNFFNGFSSDNITASAPVNIPQRYSQWKPKEQYNGDFYYTYKNKGTKIKFQSSYMKENLLSKGSLIPPQYYTAFDDWFYSSRFTNRLEYTGNVKSFLHFKILGSHSFFRRENETLFKDLNQLSSVTTERDTTKFNAYILRLLLGNDDEKKLNFTTGIDLNYEIGEGEKIQEQKKEIGDYAFFTSINYKINNKINIQPGVRFAYNSLFNVPPVPSLNLKWNIASLFTLRASYARGYRAPTLKELYIYFVDINHNIQPNKNLKAEYGNNFDLKLAFNTEKQKKLHYSQVELGLFYNNMKNIIYLARRQLLDKKDFIYQYLNVFKYNTLGGQISFNYSYYPYMDFNLSVGETATYSAFNEKKQNLSDYKFSTDVGLNMSHTIQKLKLRLSFIYKYTGKSYLYSINENDDISITKMDDYHTIDFNLNRKFIENKLIITVGVKNVLDNTNINISGGGTGMAHSSGNSSPVGYGRVFFTKLSYNIFR